MSDKYHKSKDPFIKREQEQYGTPVPSREYIINFLDGFGKPVPAKKIIQGFDLKSDDEREGLRRRLIAMTRDGQIIANRRGSYGLVSKMELVRGRVLTHRDGFGFLIPDDGGDDIFMPARQVRGVFTDDVVLVRVISGGARRREGVIVEVLERNTHQVVGRYYNDEGVGYVDPDNKAIPLDISIPPGNEGGAENGQFVVAEILGQPGKRRGPHGRVIAILGDHLTPGMEVELAIRSHELPFEWSEAVLQEAGSYQAEVTEKDKAGRNDLRHLPFVTIDGEDAQDFDDAIYCKPVKGKGWTLWVAIADVSHYVRTDSALDKEAKARGNSAYFPAKVIPMLPETLSNNLCSLKPEVDRLVLVCEMDIDEQGVIEDFRFSEAVIHSHARLTYTEVSAMIDGKKTQNHQFYKHLKPMYQLYKKLLRRRLLRGAMEFNTTDTQIHFDDKGKIDCIKPTQRNEAHRLIEEAMLAANVCTAKWLAKHKMPFLYRVHEGPQESKLIALRDFLKAFSLRLSGGTKPHAMDYAKLLERVHKRPDAHLIQMVMLRSLQQALYLPDNAGHFGLAYDEYCHFTSPIRRYPDLLVHRAIKHVLQGRKPKKFPYDQHAMLEIGEHCSMTERRADRATREATDWLKCEYMQDKVGEVFDGRITEVTGFGVFAELDEIYVQGLLHVTSLKNDYYHHDQTHHLLRGKRGGHVYRLGDPIKVLVARVDLDKRKIDFDLVD